MAKVYKHKKRGWQVRYVVYFPDGTDSLKYRYVQSQSDASLLLCRCEYLEASSRSGSLLPREIVRARHDGLISDTEAVLLSGDRVQNLYDLDRIMANYMASSQMANTPYGHLVNSRRALRLRPWLEAHPLPTLSGADIKQYLLSRRDGSLVFPNEKTGTVWVGCSAKTARNELTVLQQVIDEAVKLGMVETNVARSVNVPVKTSRVRRSMSGEEVQRLMDVADANRNLCHGYAYQMVAVALYTGLRRGELRALQWADVDLVGQKLAVQSKVLPDGSLFTPKSGVARHTTIPDPLVPILSEMPQTGAFVFGGEWPIAANRFYKTFKDLLERAGLPGDLSLHHARHTYTSWLLRLTGGDLKYVQGEVGHLDLSTTKKYAHSVTTDSPAKGLKYD